MEGTIARKADSSAVEKLQRRKEDIESKLKQQEEKQIVGKSWADIVGAGEKRTVEEAVQNHSRTGTMKTDKTAEIM